MAVFRYIVISLFSILYLATIPPLLWGGMGWGSQLSMPKVYELYETAKLFVSFLLYSHTKDFAFGNKLLSL